MKKATIFIVTMLMVMALTACGEERESTATVDNSTKTVETMQEELDTAVAENEELQKQLDVAATENEALQKQLDVVATENEALQKQLTTVVAENEALKEQVEEQNEAAQTPASLKVQALYNGKLIELKPQSEIEAINNPVDIYEGFKSRDICFLISGLTVKSVYVNQSPADVISNSDGTYTISYYMPDGGQYTLLIQTETANYYVSVLY